MTDRSARVLALPPGVPTPATGVSAEWLEGLANRLRAAGGGLARRSASEIACVLGSVGARFLDPDDDLRREALDLLPESSGLTAPMAKVVVDGMAADWREERLRKLLDEELGGPGPLDGFVPRGTRRVMAVGPSLCVQVVAGSVPGVGVTAVARSLLMKAPTLLKPGRGDTVLPTLFARGLRDEDAGVAEALAVVYWPGGSTGFDAAALAAADVVTAYGSDASVEALRALTPVTTRFVAYHHRVSVAVIGREALSRDRVKATAADLALAVALFDQRGCVSPQVAFVEEGGEVTAADFASALAAAFAEVEAVLPTGPVGLAGASSLAQARDTAELVSGAHARRVRHGGAEPWTVILGDAGVSPGVGRWLRVQPVAGLPDVAELLRPLGPHLQTVGVAGEGGRYEELARTLASAGASRISPLRRVPFPPPWWHHDGGGPLTDLVRWVDWESD